MRGEDTARAYRYFPHEHTDCSVASAAAMDLDVALANVATTCGRASELYTELRELTTIVATANDAAMEEHRQWPLDAVRAAAGEAAQICEQMKESSPAVWGWNPVNLPYYWDTQGLCRKS